VSENIKKVMIRFNDVRCVELAMVLDAHTHVGSITYGTPEGIGNVETADPAEMQVDYDLRTEVMNQNGIDQAVFMPSFSFDKSEGIESYRKLNDCMERVLHEHDRLVAGMGTVPLDHGTEPAIEELERIADMDLKGISWHHRFQGGPIDLPNTMEILDHLDDLHLVAFIHCFTPISTLESLDRLDKVIEYTDQPVVVLDATYDIDNINKLIDLGSRHDNLYVDTALMFSIMQPLERLVDGLGAERVLFGSNLYTEPLTYRDSVDLFHVRNADISEEERELILEGNVRRLLDL
jgi:predicted TIM-barrel fold metal-dependent hydrolase